MARRYLVPLIENRGLDSRLSDHFGQAEYFAVLVQEDSEVKLDRIVETPKTAGIRPGEFAVQLGVDAVVIRGGIGMRAVELLTSRGIKILQTDCEDLKCVVDSIRENRLREFTGQPCPGHEHH